MAISSIPLPGFSINGPRPARRERSRVQAPAPDTRPPEPWVLFENLRLVRSRLAKEMRIKPKAVLPDKSLMQLVRVRPSDTESLAGIYGFGEVKLKRYGKDFLEAIRSFEIARNTGRAA